MYVPVSEVIDTYITCHIDGKVPNPGCEATFEDDGYLFSIHYNKTLLKDWRPIQDASKALISEFKANAR